jgi:hypothetical protein
VREERRGELTAGGGGSLCLVSSGLCLDLIWSGVAGVAGAIAGVSGGTLKGKNQRACPYVLPEEPRERGGGWQGWRRGMSTYLVLLGRGGGLLGAVACAKLGYGV